MDNADLIRGEIKGGNIGTGLHLSYDTVCGNSLTDHIFVEFGDCACDLDFWCADGEFSGCCCGYGLGSVSGGCRVRCTPNSKVCY
jgi:hypothetical protein